MTSHSLPPQSPQGTSLPGQRPPAQEQGWQQPGYYQQPGYHQQPTADRGARARRLAGWITLGGATVLALGSVLPWATVMLVGPVYGTDGDGVITLGLAVLAAVVGLLAGLGKGRRWMFVVAALLALLAGAIGAYDLSNISSLVSGESMADLGPGLPVVIVGALAVLGGAVFGIARGRR